MHDSQGRETVKRGHEGAGLGTKNEFTQPDSRQLHDSQSRERAKFFMSPGRLGFKNDWRGPAAIYPTRPITSSKKLF
jgi:hypothetical protein